MCKGTEVILIQRICRLPECRAIFHICSSCDRGQCYCSPHCRAIARYRQVKAANLRFNNTPTGRLDRNDRQRAWRQRHKDRLRASQNESVMYHGSIPLSVVAVSVCQGSLNRRTAVLEGKTQVLHVSGPPRCVICGRFGRLVNPFFIKKRHYP